MNHKQLAEQLAVILWEDGPDTEHNSDTLARIAELAIHCGYGPKPDPDAWHCDDCGQLIDSATAGCQNPHCGETPDEKRLRIMDGCPDTGTN